MAKVLTNRSSCLVKQSTMVGENLEIRSSQMAENALKLFITVEENDGIDLTKWSKNVVNINNLEIYSFAKCEK